MRRRTGGFFGAAVESSFQTAQSRVLARAAMTAIAIVLVFGGVVGILWVGAQNVLAGEMSGGLLSQLILYAVLCATSIGALSEVWGEVQLAAGATERLVEILEVEPQIKAPKNPKPLPEPVTGQIVFDKVTFQYPTRPQISALSDFSRRLNRVRLSRWSVRQVRKKHRISAFCRAL